MTYQTAINVIEAFMRGRNSSEASTKQACTRFRYELKLKGGGRFIPGKRSLSFRRWNRIRKPHPYKKVEKVEDVDSRLFETKTPDPVYIPYLTLYTTPDPLAHSSEYHHALKPAAFAPSFTGMIYLTPEVNPLTTPPLPFIPDFVL
jgi:hypothetical protein